MTKKCWNIIFWTTGILGTVYVFIMIKARENGLLDSEDIRYSKLVVILFLVVISVSNIAVAETEEQKYGRVFGILATVLILISKYLW